MTLLSWFTSLFIGLGYIHVWIYPDKMKTTFSPVLVPVSLELSLELSLVLELSPVLVPELELPSQVPEQASVAPLMGRSLPK